MLVLSPDGKRLLKHWTPSNQDELNDDDLDLGSTAPALLADGYFVQGGKDGQLRLLRLSSLAGVDATTGGELQTVPVPGPTDLFSEPATWKGSWVFLATSGGHGRLAAPEREAPSGVVEQRPAARARCSPAVCSTSSGPATSTSTPRPPGTIVGDLPIGDAHWQSPIVADGRVAAGEGNANDHQTSGVLDIYRLA